MVIASGEWLRELKPVCHICGDERPKDKISVLLSAATDVITQNVYFCNDRPACIAGAKTKRERFTGKP